MKVVQLLPALAFGDAVGNDAVAIRKILEEEGYETESYTDNLDPRLPEDSARPVGELPELQESDILIYHACTGGPLNYRLPEFGGRKVVIYHNITPPAFFHDWSPEIEKIQNEAYQGMAFLHDKADYCIADSEYNKSDLIRMGYTCPIDVCPIVIPFEDYQRTPDQDVIDRYREDGWTNLLFVGRVAPNKKQEDIIRAFYCYQRYYNQFSRLFLVGSSGGMDQYADRLKEYARQLHIEDKVIFLGHISFEAILGYYRLADAFLCMSEHEGFCVPLVEAMLFRVPIVAYQSSAVPDTLGRGGLLLPEKDPVFTAAAVNRIISDKALQNRLKKGQQEMLDRFRYDAVKQQFLKCLRRAVNL